MVDTYLGSAQRSIAKLAARDSALSVNGELPAVQGNTNRVVFGSYRNEPVAIKFYADAGRCTHEEFALNLLRPTGLVPVVLPVKGKNVLVMTRLPGRTLAGWRAVLSGEELNSVYVQVGHALAALEELAPRASGFTFRNECLTSGLNLDFYRHSDFSVFFDKAMEASERCLPKEGVSGNSLLTRVLGRLIDNRDLFVSRESYFHQDDLNSNNILVERRKLSGFVDVEMSRFGNTLSMLGAAFSCLCLEEPGLWKQIRMGFEEKRGSRLEEMELDLIRGMAAFHVWVRFSWRWGSDNLPPSPVERSSRSEINSRLIRVIEAADIIADKDRCQDA